MLPSGLALAASVDLLATLSFADPTVGAVNWFNSAGGLVADLRPGHMRAFDPPEANGVGGAANGDLFWVTDYANKAVALWARFQVDGTTRAKLLYQLDTDTPALDANSDFLQLLTTAKRSIDYGAVNLVAGGSTAARSQTATINHGLGVVPQVVIATAKFGAWTTVNCDNYTTTQFQASGSTVDGSGYPASIAVAWIAIG